METTFADRISDVPRSFIREILKVAADPSIISFAGGLPNRAFFPVEALKAATDRVFAHSAREALQYSNSEGHPGLRAWIAERYKRVQGLDIDPRHILITTGSQQGLDLMAKILLNEGEGVIIEEPGYLGALQAFGVYRARFLPVPLDDEGLDLDSLPAALGGEDGSGRSGAPPKLLYTVPNFQNPGGTTYTEASRRAVARIMEGSRTLLIEDDPYGDLRFEGERLSSFGKLLPGQTVLLGSFSKTVAPAFRLGWIAPPPELFDRLLVAKQAADLHTNYFTQQILYNYLEDNDLDQHIKTIVAAYRGQRDAMVQAIQRHFPPGVTTTRPAGGMFLWARLPEHQSSLALFDRAIERRVAFVPGHPFYVGREWTNTLRLNFSCADPPAIEEGIGRLGALMREAL